MTKFSKKVVAVLLALALIIGCVPAFAVLADTGDYTSPTNLPAMYINLDDNFPQDQIDKETYRSGKISLVGAEGFDDIVEAVGSIKGRGNYSWSAEKKPYAIKFESKTNLLGMGKAKKWVLIANYWDKTMLRNYITMNMANDIGMKYTTEVRFIDLYINGVYRGNYLLTEKVEIGKERINVDDENGGVLFEIEQQYRHTDCTYCYQTASGVHMTYKEPEFEDDLPGTVFNTEFIQNMMNTMNPWLDKLDSSLSQGSAQYSQYIDVDSFVDWYIVNEFCKNYDSQFVTSCYCYYDPADKLLHMGPVWDYDTCYGNQSANGYGVPEGYLISSGSPWYRILMNDSDFLNKVKARWTDLKESGQMYHVLQNVIDGAQLIAQSQELNNIAWPNMLKDGGPRGDGSQTYYTYKEEVDYLKKFIAKRILWLDEQWNTDTDNQTNQIESLKTICYGLLIDNSMAIEDSYFTEAYEIYKALPETEVAALPTEISTMFEDYDIFSVESAIKNAAAITSYSQKAIVENARALYDALPADKKAKITNYQMLLDAEAKVIELAAGLGIANVMKNNITDKVIQSSISGTNGYQNETVDRVFDGDTSTKYCGAFNRNDGSYIQWEMSTPVMVNVYAIGTANDFPQRSPGAWTLEGSSDGQNWTLVDTVADGDLPEEPFSYREFFCDSPSMYQYYRIHFTSVAGNDGNLQYSEIMLGGTEDQAIKAVTDAIQALGEVTDVSQRAEVEAVREMYNALSDEQKMMVPNYFELVEAEAMLVKLDNKMDAVNAVNDKISAISNEVALSDEGAIVAARDAYDKLSEAEQLLVSNYEKLTTAETVLTALKKSEADIEAAGAVDKLIEAIGEITSKDQRAAVVAARTAYNNLTAEQKALVKNLKVLVAAESALSVIDMVANTIETIATISSPVTYKDGPTIIAARRMFNSLSTEDKIEVTNLEVLENAEAAIKVIHDAFTVEIQLNADRADFTKTPWMNGNALSAVDMNKTMAAMADEYKYQYCNKGYQLGITTGYYTTSNHGGYLMVQSDVHYNNATLDYTDNVGNPWGQGGRYWATTIAPFAGMAFSVNGYLSSSTYGYEMPLCDSFEYDGKIYQVYDTGVKYHENIPLVKDSNPAFATFEYFPGSGDENNNRTFMYTYAKYSQENKWDDKVIGVPYGNAAFTSDNSVVFQKFYSNDGDAYIAGASQTISAANPDSGSPAGAFTITGAIANALGNLAADDTACFEITGAPKSEYVEGSGMVYQEFDNGVIVVLDNGSEFFMQMAELQPSIVAASELETDIDELPDFDSMDKTDYDNAVEIKSDYDSMTDLAKALVSDTMLAKLNKALTWTDTPAPQFILGDLDNDGKTTVSDVVALRKLIMNGKWSDELLQRGDLDGNKTLTVSDIVALRAKIMNA